MDLPKDVKIIEVSPRDGLQYEQANLPTQIKVKLINQLAQSGLKTIEATSFVSPQWVPQLADHADVLSQLDLTHSIHYPVLVPNQLGFEKAMELGVKDIAIFTACSETFCKKNINCDIKTSLLRYKKIAKLAMKNNIRIRGYISCVLGCPYEGKTEITKIIDIAAELIDIGCYEVSLGDTIGVGTPIKSRELFTRVASKIGKHRVAGHFHDTFGQALANIFALLEEGFHIFDASVAGLGGCPYAKGASGNVATEDLVYMLDGLGINTGIDLAKLINTANMISSHLNRPPYSKTAAAYEYLS